MTQTPSIDIGARMAAARATAVAGAPAWANVTGKPTTFTPSAHAHVIADVTGLQTALDEGSDPWTYIKLATDYPTTLATWATVTGMSFTPAANTDYEVEWCLLCQTAVTTVGARPGISWGTGYEYGGVALYTPSSATAQTIVNGSINNAAGTAQAAVGGLPIINRSYAHYGQATFRSGTTPTAFNLQLASETAGTAVTAKAGSWLKYRTI